MKSSALNTVHCDEINFLFSSQQKDRRENTQKMPNKVEMIFQQKRILMNKMKKKTNHLSLQKKKKM